MATYKFYLTDSQAKGETGVILRMADKKKTCKFYTDLRIEPKHWNSKTQEARKTYPGTEGKDGEDKIETFAIFNELLKKRYNTLKALHEKLKNEDRFTIEALRREFYEECGKIEKENKIEGKFETLSSFAKYYIDSVESSKKANTIIQNRQTLKILKEFEGTKKGKITFDRVNLDFYHDFMDYLTKTKKFSENTKGKHIATIKLFLNEATERGVNKNTEYKSKRFKTTSEAVQSEYLNEEELDLIYNHDFTKNKKLEQTRDLFIIGSWTGLRFSDFSQLKIENIQDGVIKVKTQKTGEIVVIPLHWTVKEIMEKYAETASGLPRPYSIQKMNEYIKDVARKVGINKVIPTAHTKGGLKVEKNIHKFDLVTTHTARRSFATNLYLQGFPAISIMKITGHRTEKSFMKYIKISQEENAKLLQIHWSKNVKLKVV